MLSSQNMAADAVLKSLKDIEKVVKAISKKLQLSNSSRIVYCGAGSSGRIAVQDGVELFPTFSWPQSRIEYIIAGGHEALTKSIENSEDKLNEAKKEVLKVNVNSGDVVICLAASSQTPFTLEVLRLSKISGALTIGIGNNPDGKIQKISDYGITLDTGYEIVAGSTRLKAGTAQKICLNLISTLVMCNLGHVKNGEMIHFVPMNKKLRIRKKIMIKKLKSN